MSNIDKRALREAAEKAGSDKWQAKKINGDFYVIRNGSYEKQHGFTSYQPIAEIEHKPVRDFVAAANPATVLALLDELEASEKRIAELETTAFQRPRLMYLRRDSGSSQLRDGLLSMMMTIHVGKWRVLPAPMRSMRTANLLPQQSLLTGHGNQSGLSNKVRVATWLKQAHLFWLKLNASTAPQPVKESEHEIRNPGIRRY